MHFHHFWLKQSQTDVNMDTVFKLFAVCAGNWYSIAQGFLAFLLK